MASNYERSFKSAIFDESWFESLNDSEFKFYMLIHLGPETSDTSVFPISLKRIAYHCNVSIEESKKLIEKFVQIGIVEYDFEFSEILVIDYFRHNPPRGGLMYEGYRKDIGKIRSKKLLDRLAEIAKKYVVTIQFLSALDEFTAIEVGDYILRESKETLDSVKTAQKRGRDKIAENRKADLRVSAEDFSDDIVFPF